MRIRLSVVLVAAFSLVIGGVSSYLICTSRYNKQVSSARYEAAQKATQQATQKQKVTDESTSKEDMLKLHICINKANDTAQQTSCFRQETAGVLPEPTVSDLNGLPDLY